jgi:hypothetical protein
MHVQRIFVTKRFSHKERREKNQESREKIRRKGEEENNEYKINRWQMTEMRIFQSTRT